MYLIVLNNYKGKNETLINLFIITLKQYIYASKCMGSLPKFPTFVEKLTHWYNMDKTYAIQNNGKKIVKKGKIYFKGVVQS